METKRVNRATEIAKLIAERDKHFTALKAIECKLASLGIILTNEVPQQAQEETEEVVAEEAQQKPKRKNKVINGSNVKALYQYYLKQELVADALENSTPTISLGAYLKPLVEQKVARGGTPFVYDGIFYVLVGRSSIPKNTYSIYYMEDGQDIFNEEFAGSSLITPIFSNSPIPAFKQLLRDAKTGKELKNRG